MLFRTACRHLGRKAPRKILEFPDLHGFAIKNVRRIDDLHLVVYEMLHEATKAPYYHVDTDDANNTFCIGFRTPASNNKGTAHVLEHTTLCGSEKHPIRDPFFLMLRRSLSTFMNALTGAEYTLYPFSTTNTQDFQNLLSVYLDAVFCPLLRREDFKQEGHRVEVDKALEESGSGAEDSSQLQLLHNGVVFNEMRGVASDPNAHFYHRVLQVMLPGTHYQYNSGGDPQEILKLTYEELVEFHRKHYTPSNSVVFTYGDQSPVQHMRALDEYFRRFSVSEPVQVPTLQETCRFDKPIAITEDGPLDVMGNPKLQKRIVVSYAIPEDQNSLKDVVELSVLDDLLSMGPGAPMFKTLIESQIGAKFSSVKGYISYLSSPIFSYGVSGVDEERPNAEGEVLAGIHSALEMVRQRGFDTRRVHSVVFQQELHQRHRSTSFGLSLCTSLGALALCRGHTNPIDYINWLPHLRTILEDNGRSLIPLIEKTFLSNPHRAIISVSAKKEFSERFRARLQQLDDELNEKTSPEEKEKIRKETCEWLERVRAPQNCDVLPTLRISDIPKNSFREPAPRPSVRCPRISTIGYQTNGLVYVHGAIPHTAEISRAMALGGGWSLPKHFPQLVNLLARTGAGKYSFRELSTEVNLVCGGFSFDALMNESFRQKGTVLSGTTFGFYTTTDKLEEALELLRVTFLEPRTSIDDPDVISRTLSRSKMACTQSIRSLQSSGHLMAVSAASARLTRYGAIYERWWGLEKSKYASEMLEKLQGDAETCHGIVRQLVSEYKALTESLVQCMKSGLLFATCEEEDQHRVEAALWRFRESFPGEERTCTSSSSESALHIVLPSVVSAMEPRTKEELLPIDTSYVGLAIVNDLTWTHKDHAALRVACQLLDNEYMHRRVREEGGAYGASVKASLIGEVGGVAMSSFRDPTPNETITAFDEARDWLADAKNITPSRVDEAKLRMFSKIDSPYTADSFGCVNFLNDVQHELKQQVRDALLSVTPAQVMNAAKYLDTSKGVISVLKPSNS